MALRSLARTLPLRSPAAGPAVRALRSPAAAPRRLLSDRAQTEELKILMEEYRRELAIASAFKDAELRHYKHMCQIYMRELQKVNTVCDVVLVSCPIMMLAAWIATQ